METSILRKLLSLSSIAYLEVAEDFKIIDAAFGVQLFAEYPQEVVKGKDIRSGFPEMIGLESSLTNIIKGQQKSFELKGISRSSTENCPRYFDIYVIKAQPEEGKENRLLICFKDVTERMIVEQELTQYFQEESLLLEATSADKDYLNQIIIAIAYPLIVTTPAGIIQKVNRAAECLLGYREVELINRHISAITDNMLLNQASYYYLLDPKSLNNIEVVCQTKSGAAIKINFSGSVIHTNLGDIKCFIYIGHS
ncbi:MAG TPA: hypothetical protein DDZ80_09690 [Cyanobacteria bacterium UBA8803]|nr:hypothetical protein [Cyanobacteria bacterium UBA9273]HBL58767.1 hypothetical protein [Cyanobacteria bacterium UBA8803]